MSRYISEKIADEVASRTENRCEYCRIAIVDTYFGGEIDHIRSLKHGGKTVSQNLALACQPCNRNKGNDLGSISTASKTLVRFFNPRTDIWSEHFCANAKAEIEHLTDISEVTVSIFGLNVWSA